ncbi:putative rRNA methylase [Pseudomonas aeruginosa]|nr:putative rRNA methylase [Pseudomonas aeruginosa]
MFHVILFQPEIPPNTGNIIRLCANAGCSLHLIEPLGFELDDKRLRRAGLDYHEYASVRRYPDLQSCLEALGQPRLFAFTTKGSRAFHEVAYQRDDAFLFGPEKPRTAGGRAQRPANRSAPAPADARRLP